RRFSRSPIRR
nr:Chain C, ARG-ARG-PHE-SER-ARG-SER-PRO-ILE-ARG-ARG [Homo sapiens]